MLALVIIGDEILSGKVVDENLPFMIDRFSRAGYPPCEVRIIGDNLALISRTVGELMGHYSYVVTAGGVGPTHDDLTHAGVAAAFGVPLQANSDMLAFLSAAHGNRLTSSIRRMAMLPQGAEVIGRENGGWPIIRKCNCFMLPGLPRALREKIPRLITLLPELTPAWDAAVYLDAEEVLFAEWLEQLQWTHTHVSIGSYPVSRNPEYKTRITVSAPYREPVVEVQHRIERFARDRHWYVRSDAPASRGSIAHGG